jgi:uncharacterized protein
MKTLTQTVFLILISSWSYGQEITGEWKGALEVQGTRLRIVFHVNKINNQLEATVDSPDQNAAGIKVTAVNFVYPNVKFEVSSTGGVYEGTMSSDKTITGKWVQAGTAYFLALVKSDVSPDKDIKK